jgi:hypothetical protein
VACTEVDLSLPRPAVIAKPVNSYTPLQDPVSLEQLRIVQEEKLKKEVKQKPQPLGSPPMIACNMNGAHSVTLHHEKQQTMSWCWAATGRTILTHYQRRYCKRTPPEDCEVEEQCKLVNRKTGNSDCCEVKINPDLITPPLHCYKGGWPDQVLNLYNYEATPTNTALDWPSLTNEICLDNPFLYVIKRRAGGKHVLIVKGFSYTDPLSAPSDKFEWVEIYDPLHSDYEFIQHREFVGDLPNESNLYGYEHVYDFTQIQPNPDY